MRILLTTDSETITLAGASGVSDRDHGSARDLEISASIEKQIIRTVRSDYARPIDRGNLSTQIRFTSQRLFPSAAEAEQWAANHPEIPREGIVVFDTGGGRRKLLDAVLDPPAVIPAGCSVTAIYRAAGGAIVLIEPDCIIETGDVQPLDYRIVEDATAKWFECGFLSPFILPGNAADGWTDPGGNLLFRIERSDDLSNWDHDLTDAPGSPVTEGDNFRYWARAATPLLWKFVTVDVTLTTSRHSKSITALKLFGSTISLPHYPYAMPAAAATLQADLIAAGYTGSVVSSVSHALSVEVFNNTNVGRVPLPVVLSGSNVTAVKTTEGATISLPGYPYAMPSQATTLQANLVSAGYPYASVRVYGDTWTIFVPNRDTVFNNRQFIATITPADPYTYQGLFGIGTDSGSLVQGSFGNLRATTGLSPLTEAARQFARCAISAGPNYQY